jgi:hypothetical protein
VPRSRHAATWCVKKTDRESGRESPIIAFCKLHSCRQSLLAFTAPAFGEALHRHCQSSRSFVGRVSHSCTQEHMCITNPIICWLSMCMLTARQ